MYLVVEIETKFVKIKYDEKNKHFNELKYDNVVETKEQMGDCIKYMVL